MMSERVKVIVRCRPLNIKEKDLQCKNIISIDNKYCTCSVLNPADENAVPKTFTFDGVYNCEATTEEIYNEIAFPLIECVLDGYNATIFAYGQTGCGKSYTMQGTMGPVVQKGLTSHGIEHIFEAISLSENTKYLVLASYLEIYNDEVHDLLGLDVKQKLEVKENAETGVCVPGLSFHSVQNVSECEKLLATGWQSRTTAETLMNSDSSRSHSIFCLHIEMVSSENNNTQIPHRIEHIKRGKLNLVDLAGSERQSKAGCSGIRLKEATKINLSLSALGNVISALVDDKTKYIPYRDSKLTRLLQDSLGGNTKTLMVACLSPADYNYEETLSTLRYANRAKNIKNKPHINEDPKDAKLREAQEEICRLKEILENSLQRNEAPSHIEVSEELFEKVKDKVRSEYEETIINLMKDWETEHSLKYALEREMEHLRSHYEEQLENAKLQIKESSIPNTAYVSVINCFSSDFANETNRLKQLQQCMVGGEHKDNSVLKTKYLNRKQLLRKCRKHSPKRLLEDHEETLEILPQVCVDLQSQLFMKSEELQQIKKKVCSLESLILNQQHEFNKERGHLYEVIKRLKQDLKLHEQIAEKLISSIRRDCNYSNLDHIKDRATWIEELSLWKLPDIFCQTDRLPSIASINSRTLSSPHSPSSESSHSYFHDHSDEQIIWQKLQRGAEEDIAGNYFKSYRANQLLEKCREAYK